MIPNNFTNVAIEAAKAGAEALEENFNNNRLAIDYKGEIDPVTAVDRRSQGLIIDVIREYFPKHSIISEETNKITIEQNSDYCWIIDPLDGTVNYIHGLSIFSVSIALQYKTEIISAVVYAPLLKGMFIAEKGAGAYLNNNRINVSANKELIRSLIVTGFPYYIHAQHHKIAKNFVDVMLKAQGVRRLGSAALDLAYVAAGRFDAFWEEGLSPWDVAAGSLIVKEAGGKITDYDAKNNYIFGKHLLASNGLIHKQMLEIINQHNAGPNPTA